VALEIEEKPTGNSSVSTAPYPQFSDIIGCLGNLYVSNRNTNRKNLVYFSAKGRMGTHTQILHSITNNFLRPNLPKNTAIGCVFEILQGPIKYHVMPDFPSTDLYSSRQVTEWLRFFKGKVYTKKRYFCFSTLIADPLLEDKESSASFKRQGWRTEHTHFFSSSSSDSSSSSSSMEFLNIEGGHYHGDFLPCENEEGKEEEVWYRGFLVPEVDFLVRIDGKNPDPRSRISSSVTTVPKSAL